MENSNLFWPSLSLGVSFLLCVAAFTFENLGKREWKADPAFAKNLKYLGLSRQFSVILTVGCLLWFSTVAVCSIISAKSQAMANEQKLQVAKRATPMVKPHIKHVTQKHTATKPATTAHHGHHKDKHKQYH